MLMEMKYVIAIIQSHKLEEVRAALTVHGINALLVVEAQRYGSHEEHREYYRGAEYDVGFMPKTKIEFAVSSELADKAVTALRAAAIIGNRQMDDGGTNLVTSKPLRRSLAKIKLLKDLDGKAIQVLEE